MKNIADSAILIELEMWFRFQGSMNPVKKVGVNFLSSLQDIRNLLNGGDINGKIFLSHRDSQSTFITCF